MNIKSAVLIGQTTYYLQNEKNDLSGFASEIIYATEATRDKSSGSADLILISPKDLWAGTHRLCRNENQVPEYWENKIDSTYLRAKVRNNYLTWQLFIKLNPKCISTILKELKPEKFKFINELFHTLLPEGYGKPINATPSLNTAYILYLEPEEDLLANSSDTNQLDMKKCAEKLASFLGQEQHSEQPNLLHDVFVFRSIEKALNTHVSLTAIRTCPSKQEYNEDYIVLPKTVYHIGHLLAIIHILRHVKSRLYNLPFIKRTISNYVEQLKNNVDLLSSAASTFLKDREIALNEYFSTLSLLDKCNAELEDSYVTYASDNGFLIDIDTSISDPLAYAYRCNVLTYVLRGQTKEFTSVRKLLLKLREHTNAISDYIRDKAAIESSKTSLKLQKTMRWIALFALVVAILTIIVTFFV